jgi:hypothetical protein
MPGLNIGDDYKGDLLRRVYTHLLKEKLPEFEAGMVELAGFTGKVLINDGSKWHTSRSTKFTQFLKRDRALFNECRPFLINNSGLCKCGHRKYDHATWREDPGRWIPGPCEGKRKYIDGVTKPIPCETKCQEYEVSDL